MLVIVTGQFDGISGSYVYVCAQLEHGRNRWLFSNATIIMKINMFFWHTMNGKALNHTDPSTIDQLKLWLLFVPEN